MSRLLFVVIVVVCVLPDRADAQWVGSYGDYYGYGGYGWGTTPEEAAYRGFAEALRARGEAQRAAADAALRYEEARSKYIENLGKWADTYSSLERQRIGARNLEKERRREELKRRLEVRRKLSESSRLSPSEFDPTTGFIKWPDALTTSLYKDDRQRLEELLTLQRYSRGRPDIAVECDRIILKLHARLSGQFKNLLPIQWTTANRFLRSLRGEVARLFRR